jgi:hypothetical protein
MQALKWVDAFPTWRLVHSRNTQGRGEMNISFLQKAYNIIGGTCEATRLPVAGLGWSRLACPGAEKWWCPKVWATVPRSAWQTEVTAPKGALGIKGTSRWKLVSRPYAGLWWKNDSLQLSEPLGSCNEDTVKMRLSPGRSKQPDTLEVELHWLAEEKCSTAALGTSRKL